MKLTTRTRYGLRAAVELALRGAWKGNSPSAQGVGTPRNSARGSGGERTEPTIDPVPLAAVAKRQGISEKYLRQIFVDLRRAHIVDAVRGRNGGYLLAREPGRIDALEVVRALGEDLEPVFCVGRPSRCKRRRECPTHPLWGKLADVLKEALASTTVAELAERCPVRGRQSLPRGYAFDI